MFIQRRDLNYLPTFPTLSKHSTFFPIMNIKRFFIKFFISPSTESTCSFFIISFLILLLLHILSLLVLILRRLASCTTKASASSIIIFFIFIIIITSAFLVATFFRSYTLTFSLWIYISHYSFLWCIITKSLATTRTSINFCKCCF